MPLLLPKIDDRRYDDLLGEALARLPIHTPEYTNFNRSDGGVTLIEVFAFLTESLLYRANQIPDRNRKKFLQLLRIPLQTATAARGLVTIDNDAPAAQPVVIHSDIELRAGTVPFRTTKALDVLPVEGRLFVKKRLPNPPPEVRAYYQQLYASYRDTTLDIQPELYQAQPFPAQDQMPVALTDTIDNALWLALLVRDADANAGITPELVRNKIAARTLTIGVVPSLSESSAVLPAGRPFGSQAVVSLRVECPLVPPSGGLPDEPQNRRPQYQPLSTRTDEDLFSVPGTLDVTLPDAAAMRLWNNIDPLEAGVDDLPPALEDETVEARIVTWLRIKPSTETDRRFLWMAINAVPITQSARVLGEILPDGTGEPDQSVKLALAPVLANTVRLFVTNLGRTEEWSEIDDLGAAAPEIRIDDARLAPGAKSRRRGGRSTVFTLNAESGEIRFGDGVRGARPAENATLRATYEYAAGSKGNLAPGSITTAVSLPSTFTVTQRIATWGGADAESVADGEKQIARYVQHHDRLVTASDFEAITLRTPGVDIARVEVLPNFHPDFGGGEVPGAVTLMLVPAHDPEQPDAPLPRARFLEAVCRFLDPRRLVTTEVVLRGPDYQGIWISVGVKVAAGYNESQVLEAVKTDLLAFLAPTSGRKQSLPDEPVVVLGARRSGENGWKLGKAVVALELAAVANRTRGVEFVQDDVILADDGGVIQPRIEMTGLELPRVLGIRVTNGPPASLDELRGGGAGTGSTLVPTIVQIPTIPEECR